MYIYVHGLFTLLDLLFILVPGHHLGAWLGFFFAFAISSFSLLSIFTQGFVFITCLVYYDFYLHYCTMNLRFGLPYGVLLYILYYADYSIG